MPFLLIATLISYTFAAEVRSVQVTGNCQQKVIPDRARVSFTAENQSTDQKSAVDRTNTQINQLKEKIKAMKLADLELKNSSYSVFPVREYEKEKMVNKGTRVSLTLEVETSDVAKLGETLSEAAKLDIANVGTLQTFLSLEKSQAEYLNCLDIASLDARKKADQLAAKLGFKVIDVLQVIESAPAQSRSDGGGHYMAKATLMADVASTSLETGSQNFSTSIQVSFGIK